MNWGDPIRCHAGESVFARSEFMVWRPPDPEGSHVKRPPDEPPLPDGALGHPYGFPFRQCGYDGSIHPEDLYAFLTASRRDIICAACDPGDGPDDIVERHDWEMSRMRHVCRVTLGGSDWKYGWPHKFYVEGIPNPIAGRPCVSTSTSYWDAVKGARVTVHGPAEPAPPFTHAKFYNVHLLDVDDEAFELIAAVLSREAGILFSRENGKLFYRAPRAGYQR